MSLAQHNVLVGGQHKLVAMQMPNVVVHPPAEEQTPAWCFFDARNPALSQVVERPETTEISVVEQSSSIDAIVLGSSSSNVSVIDAMTEHHHNQRNGVDNEFEYDDDTGQGLRRPTRDIGNDSDVVEVIKVRRRDVESQLAEMDLHQMSYPGRKTLKSRASRAFKSFKGSLKAKPRAQDAFSPSSSTSSSQNEAGSIEQTTQETLSRSHTPTASRKGSRILSGLFNQQPLKQRPSVPSFADVPPSPTESTTQTYDSRTSSRNADQFSPTSSHFEPALHEELRMQAASPAFTTTSRKSLGRLSKLNLHKIFTFAGPTHSDPAPIPAEDAESEREPKTPTLRSFPSTPAFSSSSSNSGPETPTSTEYQMPLRAPAGTLKEDASSTSPTSLKSDLPVFDTLDSLFSSNTGLNLGLGLGIDLDSAVSSTPRHPSGRQSLSAGRRSSSSSMWSAITPRRLSKSNGRQPSPVEDDEDEELEIQLNSLHFDDLSFDPDRFTCN